MSAFVGFDLATLTASLEEVQRSLEHHRIGFDVYWGGDIDVRKPMIPFSSSRLPKGFKSFLNVTNGLSLSLSHDPSNASSVRTLRIFNPAEILEQMPDLGAEYSNFVVFADYGDGDQCFFDLDRPTDEGEFAIIDGYHERMDSWQSDPPIATSFKEWFDRGIHELLTNQRFEYWM